jgi:hypothetical protein
MRTLLRKPLTWMVLAECAVMVALLVVGWRIVVGATSGAIDSSWLPPALDQPAASPPLLSPIVPTPAGHGPLPGLNVDPSFWQKRLADLNRDTSSVEALEWRIAHAVMTTARGYLETVILPAVERAERRAPPRSTSSPSPGTS